MNAIFVFREISIDGEKITSKHSKSPTWLLNLGQIWLAGMEKYQSWLELF